MARRNRRYKRYKISKQEARERLERRYIDQCALYPLTATIPLSLYIARNIENVRKYDLLRDYTFETRRII